jgi:AraC-like DNA-binding protein
MALWELPASESVHRTQETKIEMHRHARRPLGQAAFANYMEPSSALAEVVEEIADWDVPDSGTARAIAVNVFPSTRPYVIFQYRMSMKSVRQFGNVEHSIAPYRHIATRHLTGVLTVRFDGPIGAIVVRLKPEAAARLIGERMQDFADAKVDLGSVFGAAGISLLEEQLSEARNTRERFGIVESFLHANVGPSEPDAVACGAAAQLRRDPCFRIRGLAAQLDVSERHLCRRFRMMFGLSPKQFARTARLETALAVRGRKRSSWAEVACACGFADQAHLINDFNDVIGRPPGDFCCSGAGWVEL